MTNADEFNLAIGGLETDAIHMIKNTDGPLSPDAISTSSLFSIAISLTRIADAMEKDGPVESEKPPTHPPFGISTAVRPHTDKHPPRKPFWGRVWYSILNPSTDWIQEDGSHSW